MKLNLIKVIALICLVAGALSSCAQGNKFDISSGAYVDKKTGAEYQTASWEYEAISVTDEIYGEYNKKYDLSFYRVGGDISPEKILSDDVGTVYYTDKVTLPTLEDKDAIDYVDIYNEYDEKVGTTEDREAINGLVDIFLDGHNIYESMYFTEAEPAVTLNRRIKFAYSDLGVYYVLAYVEYAEDFCYYDENGVERYSNKVIFNRYTQTYVPVNDTLSSYYAEAEV